MSQLLFKTMATAYCRYRQQNNFTEDCLGALGARIDSLKQKISTEMEQIREVFSDALESGEMSVIEEEESEASFSEEGMSFEVWAESMKKKCNREARELQKIETDIEKMVNVYKGQLLEMSKEMTTWEDKNQELRKNVKVFTTENQKLKLEIEDLKDQITNQAASFLLAENIDCEQIFDKPKHKTSKNKIPQKTINAQTMPQIVQASAKNKSGGSRRASIKKISAEPELINKQNSRKGQNELLKQKEKEREREKQIEKQKQKEKERQKLKELKEKQQQIQIENMKWRKLSKKIEQLKSKLVIYEEEISEKNSEIQSLQKRIKESVTQDDEKRKLKTSNTTLRGQKTVLHNQLTSLKKNYAEKVEVCDLQDMEIRQLKAQIDNFTTTIKWQTETIDDLRATVTKGLSKESEQSQSRISNLQRVNQTLVKALGAQETELLDFNQKLTQIQLNYQKASQRYFNKISELETILDEKNEIIVKLKTKSSGGSGGETQSTYYAELVKVLTKKLAEKEEVLRRLATTD